MKKALKISRNILLGLLLVIILFLGGTYLNNQIRLKSEAKKIEAYGEQLDVFDGNKVLFFFQDLGQPHLTMIFYH
jgi:hypothetical protein